MRANKDLPVFMKHANGPGRRSSNIVALGELLKQKREAAGLSQAALAHAAGVTRVAISHLENAVYQQPSPSTLARIGKTLGISMDDIYALTGYTPQADLPNLRAYLMAKYPGWLLAEIEHYCDFLRAKYELPEE
jgi:transcriptional regulator with XRE-family HTH domain